LIKEVEINNTVDWTRKHLQALLMNYKRAPFFGAFFGFFEGVYSRQWDSLARLNVYMVESLCEMIGLQTRTVLASDLVCGDEPTDRLIDICEALGGDTYLAGRDGTKYMNVERFRERKVQVIVQDFEHPTYPQLFGSFQSHLSIVDLLFNCGPESMERIRSCNRAYRSL
jgi:hypothetical protein